MKDTTVTLPEGVAVNPGGADGLEACSESEIGYLPGESGPDSLRFTPGSPEPFCPNASKIGTVEIKTPLLPNALKGAVYLGAPRRGRSGMNPFGSLLAMYIVARDPVSGVSLKLPGQVSLDPNSGQLVATFEDTPQLPFEDLRAALLRRVARAAVHAGAVRLFYTAASLAPWSGERSLAALLELPDHLRPERRSVSGARCRSLPSLTAGTTSIQAGGFSPFTMTMGREDGNQNLRRDPAADAAGAAGDALQVKLCGEPQADEGTCGPESLIGHTTSASASAGTPTRVTGGEVFITGPYEGAPFGLSIVNPAKAGPFDLGKVVVRAKIEVDPMTAALTITTDETGPYKIPTIIDGIPLQIKHINVVDRPAGLHVQPDQLQPAGDHRQPDQQRRRVGRAVGALPGHQLRGAGVQAEADAPRRRAKPRARTGRA